MSEQVLVITGASSGIGLATARRAASFGAQLVLAARSAEALQDLAREIEAAGGAAIPVVADVASPSDVENIVKAAVSRFGRFDVWVNNAGVAAYDTLVDLPLPEHRRIFETNYWGTVHGSLAAVRHFRSKGHRGTLINVGSVNSDVAVPMLSAYSASKHAVKGFTDALRRELIYAGDAIQVTLVKPSGIATPFPQHARNHMKREPRVVPPLYAPELVAEAILHAARHPVREITVGAVGPILQICTALAPKLMDRILAVVVPPLSKSPHPLTPSDNLESPTGRSDVHYAYFSGLPVSPYLTAQKNPLKVLAGFAIFGLVVARRFARR